MKILMVSVTFPYPPSRGGTQVRTFNLLQYLSQRHSVTLVTQKSGTVTLQEMEELRGWVQELVVFPRPRFEGAGDTWTKLQRWGRFLRAGVPPHVHSIYSLPMQTWIDDFVSQGHCDVITCEHSVNEIFVRPQWQEQLKTVVNVHSSVYGTCRHQLNTGTSEQPWRDRFYLPLLKRYEQRYCQKFSHLVVTTTEDQQQLQTLSPSRPIAVIPNGVDLMLLPYRSQDPGGHRLIFIGAMDNLPNIDAACFFVEKVLPKLQQKYPDISLDLVGANPTPAVLALGNYPGVQVLGRVPAMVHYLHQATVCVIPMRTGFGIKNKTLEALAAGTPVVASDRGLEGLTVDGAGVPLAALRANHVEEYIIAIDRLLTTPSLRTQLSQQGRTLIETHYTWEQQGKLYEQVLSSRS